MNGGDTSTGGTQVNPSNTPSSTPTPQPDIKPTSGTEAASILTISHEDHHSTPDPQPAATQPITPPVTPTQPVSSPVAPAASTQPAQEVPPRVPTANPPQHTPLAAQPTGQPSTPSTPLSSPATPTFASQAPQPGRSPQPLTSSLFPPQQPVQFPAQPISSDSGDVVLGTPTPKKSKKGLIIVLILLVILIIVGIVAFMVFQPSHSGDSTSQQPSQSDTGPFTTKEEVYNALYDFDYQYYSYFISEYDRVIGLKPNMKMTENTVIFPFEYGINSMNASIEETNQAYDDISSRIPSQLDDGKINIQPVKDAIATSLQAITTNFSTINDFYNAYISPLQEDPRPITCTKTPAMESLEQGRTLEAAQKYYTLYCQAVDFLANPEDSEAFQQSVRPLADDALEALNNILIDVPSAEMNISIILKELKQ